MVELFESFNEDTSVLFNRLITRGSRWLVLSFKAKSSEPGRALATGSEPMDCCCWLDCADDCLGGCLASTGSSIREATAKALGEPSGLPTEGT